MADYRATAAEGLGVLDLLIVRSPDTEAPALRGYRRPPRAHPVQALQENRPAS
jgi:hypothetical protein